MTQKQKLCYFILLKIVSWHLVELSLLWPNVGDKLGLGFRLMRLCGIFSSAVWKYRLGNFYFVNVDAGSFKFYQDYADVGFIKCSECGVHVNVFLYFCISN